MSDIFCDPMDCSPLDSSDSGISQARILEWVVISFSRGSSQARDQTWVSHMAGILHHLSQREKVDSLNPGEGPSHQAGNQNWEANSGAPFNPQRTTHSWEGREFIKSQKLILQRGGLSPKEPQKVILEIESAIQ